MSVYPSRGCQHSVSTVAILLSISEENAPNTDNRIFDSRRVENAAQITYKVRHRPTCPYVAGVRGTTKAAQVGDDQAEIVLCKAFSAYEIRESLSRNDILGTLQSGTSNSPRATATRAQVAMYAAPMD